MNLKLLLIFFFFGDRRTYMDYYLKLKTSRGRMRNWTMKTKFWPQRYHYLIWTYLLMKKKVVYWLFVLFWIFALSLTQLELKKVENDTLQKRLSDLVNGASKFIPATLLILQFSNFRKWILWMLCSCNSPPFFIFFFFNFLLIHWRKRTVCHLWGRFSRMLQWRRMRQSWHE